MDHKKEIYKLVQNTLSFCGNTIQAVYEYCAENNLDSSKFESVRFRAMCDFYDNYYKKTEVKK